jgi:hypothetical protein
MRLAARQPGVVRVLVATTTAAAAASAPTVASGPKAAVEGDASAVQASLRPPKRKTLLQQPVRRPCRARGHTAAGAPAAREAGAP